MHNATTPLCKNCMHAFEKKNESIYCGHPDEIFSPVEGTPMTRAIFARHKSGTCGPEGRNHTAFRGGDDLQRQTVHQPHLEETAAQSQLQFVLSRPPKETGIENRVNALTEFVTMAQLTEALGVEPAFSSRVLETQLRAWLDREGWQRVKKNVNGLRMWGYARPGVDHADEIQATTSASTCFYNGGRANLTCDAEALYACLHLPIAAPWGTRIEVFHSFDADECEGLATALNLAAAQLRAAYEGGAA